MEEKRLRDIEKKYHEASEGPWTVKNVRDQKLRGQPLRPTDTLCMAESRIVVPDLCQEIRSLQTQLIARSNHLENGEKAWSAEKKALIQAAEQSKESSAVNRGKYKAAKLVLDLLIDLLERVRSIEEDTYAVFESIMTIIDNPLMDQIYKNQLRERVLKVKTTRMDVIRALTRELRAVAEEAKSNQREKEEEVNNGPS